MTFRAYFRLRILLIFSMISIIVGMVCIIGRKKYYQHIGMLPPTPPMNSMLHPVDKFVKYVEQIEFYASTPSYEWKNPSINKGLKTENPY